jgi:hypothetical protein
MEFMHFQVAERKAEFASGSSSITRNDAFTMLIKANEDEGGKFQLDDQELIGNVYIMLFAGHGVFLFFFKKKKLFPARDFVLLSFIINEGCRHDGAYARCDTWLLRVA